MAERDELAAIIGQAERASSHRDYLTAERALRTALRLQEERHGPVHPDVANTLNDLGVVCDVLGRPAEAEFLYRRALGISRRTLPPGHPYISTSLQNLSDLYRSQGQPEKLARVADGGQRSGLPEGRRVEETAQSSTATPEPEAVETGEPNRVWLARIHQGARWIRASVSQWPPRALATAGGVGGLALLGMWWLGGGASPVPDQAPRELVAAESSRLREPGSSRSVGQPLTTGEPDVPRVARAAAAAAPESAIPKPMGLAPAVTRAPDRDLVEAPADAPVEPTGSSADVMARTEVDPGGGETVPLTVDPPPAPIAARPLPVAMADFGGPRPQALVVDAGVCSRLVTQSPDGRPLDEWQCQPVVGRTEPGQIVFYTRVRSDTPTTVLHRWLRNGQLDQEVQLTVEPNTGLGFRTYSVRTLSDQPGNRWRVELLTRDRQVLHAEDFIVRSDGLDPPTR